MFEGCVVAGQLQIRAGPPVSPVYNDGVPMGSNFVYSNGGVASQVNGLPFAADGSLAVNAGPVASVYNGIPLNAAGEIAITVGAPNYYNEGLGFLADGTLAVVIV